MENTSAFDKEIQKFKH